MRSVRLLHCADIHIGAADSSLGSFAQTRRYEMLLTFERIIDTAIDRKIQVAAIAGDLFDSNSAETSLVDSVIAKIAAAPNIKFIYAAGNHDPLNSSSPFAGRELPNNLFILGVKDECLIFDDLGLRVYGRSFENTHMQGEKNFSLTPPDDDYVNLMVLHGELKSDLKSDYNAITPEFITSSGMDYIALGHVHKHTEILKLENTYFAYCGCPEGQGFDELDEKGVYIGEIGKGLCNLEFVRVAKRMNIYEKVDITGTGTSAEAAFTVLSALKNKYSEDYVNNLYKIELIGDIPEGTLISADEIASRISDVVCFAKVSDRTEICVNYEELAKENTLKGTFVKKMLEKINTAQVSKCDMLKDALKLGLKAFVSEVKFDEA